MSDPIRILYVDDSALDRELVCDVLEKEIGGFNVSKATSRVDFETQLAGGDYDLVLSDFNILGFEGLQALEAAHAKDPHLPVVIVTGTGSEEIAVEALKRGAADYVIKSTHSINHLPQTIHTALANAQLAQERQQVQDELRESEERFRSAFEQAAIGMCMINTNGMFLRVNHSFCQMLGYLQQELMEKTIYQITYPEDVIASEFVISQSIENCLQPVPFEKRYVHKDGHIIWVNVSSSFVCNAMNKPLYFITQVQNITQRKQAENEIRQLNAELEQRVLDRTIQLEAANQELQAFSYSVSHDLRAPLRTLDGFSKVLLEDHASQLDETGRDYLNRICVASQHMKQLIDDLLKLSQVSRGELSKTQVNLSEILEKIKTFLMQTHPERQIDWEIAHDVNVNGDNGLLEVALGNLLNNAFKFTSQKSPAYIKFGVQNEDGHQVYHVRDNGIGFEMTDTNLLFKTFQRLPNAGKFEGTGIGLTIVQRIINRHGGQIWAEGQVGQGATFYFTLG